MKTIKIECFDPREVTKTAKAFRNFWKHYIVGPLNHRAKVAREKQTPVYDYAVKEVRYGISGLPADIEDRLLQYTLIVVLFVFLKAQIVTSRAAQQETSSSIQQLKIEKRLVSDEYAQVKQINETQTCILKEMGVGVGAYNKTGG